MYKQPNLDYWYTWVCKALKTKSFTITNKHPQLKSAGGGCPFKVCFDLLNGLEKVAILNLAGLVIN
jgi:hypothetical protein